MRYDVGRLSIAAAWLPQAFMTEFQLILRFGHNPGLLLSGGSACSPAVLGAYACKIFMSSIPQL
jgi:hypothetical protein